VATIKDTHRFPIAAGFGFGPLPAVSVQAEDRSLSLRACTWGKNDDLQPRPAWMTEFRDVFPLTLRKSGQSGELLVREVA